MNRNLALSEIEYITAPALGADRHIQIVDVWDNLLSDDDKKAVRVRVLSLGALEMLAEQVMTDAQTRPEKFYSEELDKHIFHKDTVVVGEPGDIHWTIVMGVSFSMPNFFQDLPFLADVTLVFEFRQDRKAYATGWNADSEYKEMQRISAARVARLAKS